MWQIEAPHAEADFLRTTSFGLLQGSRMRNTKTEYVSCPSCGRTLFDLQEVTGKIQEKTGHLPGVAIAVMGCIVNGPGEMADADFGWVQSTRTRVFCLPCPTPGLCAPREIGLRAASHSMRCRLCAIQPRPYHSRFHSPVFPALSKRFSEPRAAVRRTQPLWHV